MSQKFVSREKENFAKRCAVGIGYWLIGCVMCFLVCSVLLVLMKGSLLLKMFVALCTLLLTLGLFFNWAYNAAKRDRSAVKYHNMEYDKFMPLKMAIAGPIVSYVMLALLYLCKLGVIGESYFSVYMVVEMWILPFVTMFTDERNIGSITWPGMAGITLLNLLQGATIWITYIVTYNDVDLVSLIFYRKSKKQ